MLEAEQVRDTPFKTPDYGSFVEVSIFFRHRTVHPNATHTQTHRVASCHSAWTLLKSNGHLKPAGENTNTVMLYELNSN